MFAARSGRLGASVAAILLFASSQLLAQGAKAAAVKFDIEPQPLALALNTWADQAGLQIIWPVGDPAAYRNSPAVRGQLEPLQALRVLLGNTGLTYSLISGGQTVAIHGSDVAARGTADVAGTRLADADQRQLQQPSAATKGAAVVAEGAMPPTRAGGYATEELEEVIVTGTLIRGGTPSSRVISFSRSDIERNGFSNVAALIQSIPQNFNGGASPVTVGSIAGGGNANNSTDGTGVNLRGLGNDATLVLLDGRRLAPGNLAGNFVDVSLIPLNAIERVEILPEGASALYGSDAVGGVVNFILRKDLDGAETEIRSGQVTSGEHSQLQVGQTAGLTWRGGSAMLTYEYLDESALSAADRTFTESALLPFTLIPSQERHGLFLAAHNAVGDSSELFAQGMYSKRNSTSEGTQPGFPSNRVPVKVEAYTGTAGVRTSAWHETEAELSISYGNSDSQVTAFDAGVSEPTSDQVTRSEVVSLDAKWDGTLASTRAGRIRFAVGAQYREESLNQETRAPAGAPAFEPDRDVIAGFLELNLPLLRSSESSGAPLLDLTIADRQERYSDFGSTNNPHAGLNWRPSRAVRFSATYGTSFVAPQLSKLNPILLQAAALPIFDPVANASINTIFLFGGNPDLEPQEATNWTLGLDLQPQSVPGLQAHLTYYRIRYEDRIASLLDTGFSRLFTALADEATLGPAIVQRNPPPDVVSRLQSDPAYANFTGEPDPIAVGAIVDTRDQNISIVRTEGIDFGLARSADLSWGNLDAGIEGTYVLEFENQFTSSAPEDSILNTLYNPVDLKLRAHAIMSRGPLSFGLFVNYIDRYKNDTTPEVEDVSSWTTIDATLSYDWGTRTNVFSDLSLRIGVNNLADEDPPHVVNPTAASIGIFYDGANATPLGRFVYAQLSKRW